MREDGERLDDGRLIGGRYRLAGRIGSGPNGTVWRALDEQDGRYVAVKEPRLSGDAQDEERRRAAHRLPHEARAAARVDHPAAVVIHDVLLEDELPWIVMELVEGESLHAALAARGPLPPAEAARIALAVLGALHAAHRVGIVHRDVKPSNVLLEAGGDRVVVTDFGIGATGQSGAGGASVGFVAPECVSGRGAGPASDLWSLGALLRSAVAGGEVGAGGGAGLSGRTGQSGGAGRSGGSGERGEAGRTVGAGQSGEARQTGGTVGSGPLGALLERLLAPDPHARPTAEEAAEVLAEVAGTTLPEWATEASASPAAVEAPAPSPTGAPDPIPAPHEPRRLTALSALGLLLQKKPERG